VLLSIPARAYAVRASLFARLREEGGAVDSMTRMLLMGGFALAAGLGVWALKCDIVTRLTGCATTGGAR
jgi:hypothetical protein